MNQTGSLRAITRRALRIDYRSPLICIEVEEASGSASSSPSLTVLPVVQLAGPVLSVIPAGAGQAGLGWTEVEGAYAYVLYRSDLPEGPFAILLAGTVELSYTDTPPAPGTYYYKVAAIEPDFGASELSNAVSITV